MPIAVVHALSGADDAHQQGRSVTAFELYPDTGALKSVLVEEHAADASAIVGSLGGAAATVLTAEKARRESAEARREKAKDEELGRLQREKGILEATIAIKAARAALGL